jgi:16S rRNA (cytidine1402-2'-O)-methyltransferase
MEIYLVSKEHPVCEAEFVCLPLGSTLIYTAMPTNARLYLIPVPLGEEASVEFVSPALVELINRLRLFVVENERTARRHLRKMGFTGSFDELKMIVLDENSGGGVAQEALSAILDGGEAGLMSEAGVPGIADPGEDLVLLAHGRGVKIVPVPGPSSILLALMASGLNGERFSFNGYLPVKQELRRKELRVLEQRAQSGHGAQLFIETPYRSQAMVLDILSVLNPATKLCIASNLGLSDEQVLTMRVEEWKKKSPELNRRLCIFILDK